jgi:hypothetical protein
MNNSTNQNPQSQEISIDPKLTIASFRIFDGKNQTRAFIDFQVGPFLMRGFTLVENRDGRSFFVSPPSKLGRDKENNPKNFDVISVDRGFQVNLLSLAMDAFKIAKEKAGIR